MRNKIYNKEEIKLLCISLKKLPKFFKKFCSRCFCKTTVVPPVGLRTFYITNDLVADVCLLGNTCTRAVQHNGPDPLPAIGDTIFLGSFNLAGLYHQMSETNGGISVAGLRTDLSGVSIDLGCR